MSNNKQNMKLYTEEQIKRLCEIAYVCGLKGNSASYEYLIESLTPFMVLGYDEIKTHSTQKEVIEKTVKPLREGVQKNNQEKPDPIIKKSHIANPPSAKHKHNKQLIKIYKNKLTNVLMSENDYRYLSDTQKSQMILIQGSNNEQQ